VYLYAYQTVFNFRFCCGVLLLNKSLTLKRDDGKAKTHTKIWKNYTEQLTTKIIKFMKKRNRELIFIL
jgi:uracil DNA glycosylase